MIEPTAKISERDLSGLSRAVDLMVKDTNRDIKNAVHRASLEFLISGKANTKKAKGKNRKIRGSGTFKFYAVHTQRNPVMKILVPQGQKKGKAEIRRVLKKEWGKKPRVGAAGASWNRAFNDLGKSVSTQTNLRKRAIQAASRAKKLGGNFTPSINITNKLSYLTTISPNVERVALAAAGKKLLFKINEGIEKRNSRWR